jgi:hypothetical protein
MVGRTCHHFPPLYHWQLHNEFVLWCIKFSKPYLRFKPYEIDLKNHGLILRLDLLTLAFLGLNSRPSLGESI